MIVEPSMKASHRRYGPSPEQIKWRETRDAAEIRLGCLLCDWQWVGPAGEGREAWQAHRLEAHPKPIGRPRRVEA